MKPIAIETLRGLTNNEFVLDAARFSDPLFMGWMDGIILGYVGLAPPTMLSDTAYVWSHTTADGFKHPMIWMRLSLKWIPIFQTRYPTLYGHCTDSSYFWMRRLGAEVGPMANGLYPFIIRKPNG
jgi:hypothetical protein